MSVGWPSHASTDHPRSRGVYQRGEHGSGDDRGSSPLARGLRRHRHAGGCRGGIIPARAGFTRSGSGARGRPTDHPRSRGVYVFVFCSYVCSTGSSPLARGLPTEFTAPASRSRIIPARAGFTSSRPTPWRPTPDHPRSRGVYTPASADGGHQGGSSPLARGLPDGRRIRRSHHRIHPRSRGVYSRPLC